MGQQQHASTVQGTNGVLQTAATGTMETDNYAHGDDFEAGGSTGNSFPFAINPAETMQELTFTNASSHVVEIHTTGGDVINLRLEGNVGVWDKWETDKLVLTDPNGTGDLICGGWAGE